MIVSFTVSLNVSRICSFFVSKMMSLTASFFVSKGTSFFVTSGEQSEFAAAMSPALRATRWPICAFAGLVGVIVSLPSFEKASRG